MFTAQTSAALPDRPKSVKVSLATSSTITLRWEHGACNGSSLKGYRVDQALVVPGQELDFKKVFNGPGTATSAEITGLLPAHTYALRVQAINAVGSSPFTQDLVVATAASAPAAVGKPQILRQTDSEVVIEWEAPADHGEAISEYM